MKRTQMLWGCLVVVLMVIGVIPASAQGEIEDYKIDWCVFENGQRELEKAQEASGGRSVPPGTAAELLLNDIPEPGYYDVSETIMTSGVDSVEQLYVIPAAQVQALQANDTMVRVFIEDRGVDCRTGDPYNVERLWDDKMTMVIYRDANYDISFYRTNGDHIHTTAYWMLIGPFTSGQVIDEYETLGGTLKLVYLHDDYFQMEWYAPDGSMALGIPFTYPESCAAGPVGDPRVCR